MKTEPMICQVAVPSPCFNSFDYLLPNTLASHPDDLPKGIRVLVPFGRQEKIGIFLGYTSSSSLAIEKLKPIIAVLDNHSLYTPSTLTLCQFTSHYYHHPLGDVLLTALPKRLRQPVHHLTGSVTITQKGIDHIPAINRKTKQYQLLRQLHRACSTLSYQQLQETFSNRTLNTAMAQELIKIQSKHSSNHVKMASYTSKRIFQAPDFTLTSEQQHVVDMLKRQKTFKTFLLVGVTGSGKTEVYFQVIQSILAQNKSVLFLVPEIGLTPQIIQRFQARFNLPIAMLHSGMSSQAQLTDWEKIKNHQLLIMVGTRSAVFTPHPNLGLIVVDEEHDLSFKQTVGCCYSARDLAVVRGRIENVPVILGSATPSLESLHNVNTKGYERLNLTKRVGSAMTPQLKLVNLRGRKLNRGLSSPVIDAIQTHLDQKKQIMVFLNRRGFAPKMICHDCSWIPICTQCDLPYVWHKHLNRLSCHHCGATQPLAHICPQCDSSMLWDIGCGTEKIETQLKKLFSRANILRIDRDSTRHKGSFNKMLEQIHENEVDIIIGTQMLAKGHHFPNLTLTVVIDADHGLYSQDFRALEHLGQLLVQVAGRAGRNKDNGEVYVQTYYPRHPLLQTLLKKDYHAFAEYLLKKRYEATLPPYSSAALVKVKSKKLNDACDFLNQLAANMRQQNTHALDITGPFPAPIEKKAGYYQMLLWLQSTTKQQCQHGIQIITEMIKKNKPPCSVRWNIDVDPISMSI
jgi:primosomal protein N' (replication factor Y)